MQQPLGGTEERTYVANQAIIRRILQSELRLHKYDMLVWALRSEIH